MRIARKPSGFRSGGRIWIRRLRIAARRPRTQQAPTRYVPTGAKKSFHMSIDTVSRGRASMRLWLAQARARKPGQDLGTKERKFLRVVDEGDPGAAQPGLAEVCKLSCDEIRIADDRQPAHAVGLVRSQPRELIRSDGVRRDFPF